MKQSEVMEKILAGESYRIGIYLGSKADYGTMRVEGGTTRKFPILQHAVKCGRDILPVKEKVPDDFKAELFKEPFVFGQPIAVHIESQAKDKAFNPVIYGVLFPIDDAKNTSKV